MKIIFALIKCVHDLVVKRWNEREKCRKNEGKGELHVGMATGRGAGTGFIISYPSL